MKKRKFHMKRSLIVALVCLVLVSACSQSNKTSPTATTGTKTLPTRIVQTAKTATEKVPVPTPTRAAYLDVGDDLLKGINITLMHPWQDETAVRLQELVNEFNQTNEWGISVTLLARGGADDLFDSLETSIAESSVPEIVVLNPYQAEQLDGNHFWLDISQFITDEKWGLDEETLADIPSYFLDMQKVGTRMIGFPAFVSADVLFYNVTWAKELGFNAPPTTFAQLREQSCAAYQALLKDNSADNDGTGGLLLNLSSNSVLSWFHAAGVAQIALDETPEFNNIAGEMAFGTVKSLYDEGCAWVGRQPLPYNYFAERYALFYAGDSANIGQQLNALSLIESEDEWLMLPYPSTDGKGSLLFSGPSYIISVDKPEVQLASWLFVCWMASDPVQQSFTGMSGSWPLSNTAMQSVQNSAQWSHISQMDPAIYFVPNRQQWGPESMLLQDAFWRALMLESGSLPTVLQMLDDTLLEINEMSFDD
jgi:ABC-type glycerol-3-phosphate transport system substrate-binding protein